jgi:hypothetical protein
VSIIMRVYAQLLLYKALLCVIVRLVLSKIWPRLYADLLVKLSTYSRDAR